MLGPGAVARPFRAATCAVRRSTATTGEAWFRGTTGRPSSNRPRSLPAGGCGAAWYLPAKAFARDRLGRASDYYPSHDAVRHSAGEDVRGAVHTNSIESFWSPFKRGYHGIYHRMSDKPLHRFVSEFAGPPDGTTSAILTWWLRWS